jgi:1-deoxy-D-xylulose-5-phosphate synthase
MMVMAPKDENELRHMIYTALKQPGPVAIRYPRGNGLGVTMDPDYQTLPVGESELLKEGKDLYILALGSMVSPSLEASQLLEGEGLSVGVINCRFVKPLDEKIAAYAESTGKILIVEENIRQGGLGGAVLELFSDLDVRDVRIKRLGLPDRFVEHGPTAILREKYGLDKTGITNEARELCGKVTTETQSTQR